MEARETSFHDCQVRLVSLKRKVATRTKLACPGLNVSKLVQCGEVRVHYEILYFHAFIFK